MSKKECYDSYLTVTKVLTNSKTPTLAIQRLRYLFAEIHRTVNGLNPSYMKNVFKKSDTVRLK